MQAVSLYRAIHSGDWHQMGSSSQLSLIQEIDFDLEKILFHIRKLESQCNAWEEFFLSKEIIPHRIYYEEFDEYPDKVLRDSYKFICRDDYEGKIDIQHSKMRDALSEHWAERVRCYLNESV
jgi:LPS sulfotransferase NodH